MQTISNHTDWHAAAATVEITKDFYARFTDKQEKENEEKTQSVERTFE